MSEEALRMMESTPTSTATPKTHPESERIRARNLRRMVALASRVHILPSGERLFVRFGQAAILEHWVLLGSFIVLAFTGLLEMFAQSKIPAGLINLIFRSVDSARSLHNFAALLYAGLVLVHVVRMLAKWFVKGDSAALAPSWRDFGDIGRTWKYLLSRKAPRPEFGRFTIDQKLTYWALAIFSAIMLLTALVEWFQTPIMQFMPEALLPVVRSLHSLVGLLAVVTLFPWHLYNTVLKEWNTSIFTGVMDEKTIRRNHPLEHRQIMAAYDAYRSFKTTTANTVLPPAGDAQHPVAEQQVDKS